MFMVKCFFNDRQILNDRETMAGFQVKRTSCVFCEQSRPQTVHTQRRAVYLCLYVQICLGIVLKDQPQNDLADLSEEKRLCKARKERLV